MKDKLKGKLGIAESPYTIIASERFGSWAYRTGTDALQIYQDSGLGEAITSNEAGYTLVLGAACISSGDLFRRYVQSEWEEHYQKGALDTMIEEEFDVDLTEDDVDELYDRVISS